MKTKNLVIALVVLVVLAVVIALVAPNRTVAPVETPTQEVLTENEAAMYESVTITGELQAVDQRCAMDMQCSVTIDGTVIQTSPGFVTVEYSDGLGMFDGAGNIDDINALIDTDALRETETSMVYVPTQPIMAEAYVRVHDDGMYSIYGSNDYYIRIIQ